MAEMDARTLALLCELFYFNPAPRLLARVGRGLRVSQWARAALDGETGECAKPTQSQAAALRSLLRLCAPRALRVEQYINLNKTVGLVAFVLRDEDGSTILGFRGSETRKAGNCVPQNVDWIDNLLAPFAGSVQYPAIEKLAREYPSGALITTGHSKGAHNALYALAVSDNPEARCVGFDGQGFAPFQLTQTQRERLRQHAIQYVQRNDLVGALLLHPEKRMYVRRGEKGSAHALGSMAYSLTGDPLLTSRSLISLLAQALSLALFGALKKAASLLNG